MPKNRKKPSVYILGAGKVGSALAPALRKAGHRVTLRSARKPLPKRIDCDVLMLAVRDRDLGALALALKEVVTKGTCVVHAAGALDARVLLPLRDHCAGVAQMHPMISFASLSSHPTLDRGNLHVQGDRVAVERARSLGVSLGMTPRTIPKLDTVAYHAAAGLVANGAAALAAMGVDVLVRAGVDAKVAPKMLGPLLRSVAENVERLGFPAALTGPVRRGDVGAVERARATLSQTAPHATSLFVAAVEAQIPLAQALGEGPSEAWPELSEWAKANR